MRKQPTSFAIWITGLPASGKSQLTAALVRQLEGRGVRTAVLESDALRKVFSSEPGYDDRDREYFYRSIAFIGRVLTEYGIPVIFDATANRRAYRDRAREGIPRFVEVYVDTPLEVCIQRDPKGIYRKGLSGEAPHVPGIGEEYEAPVNPEFVFHGEKGDPSDAAKKIAGIVEGFQ